MELKAYCFHPSCNSKRFCAQSLLSSNGVEKKVPKSATFCPDCRHALVWKRVKGKTTKEFIQEIVLGQGISLPESQQFGEIVTINTPGDYF